MWFGRFQVGKEITYRFLTRNGNGSPVAPDDAPLAFVYDGSGNTISAASKVPSEDYPLKTGLFEGRIFLDERFSTGKYSIRISWVISGTEYSTTMFFEIIPGGDGAGQITSMYYHQRPNASFVVNGRDSGRIYKGKNARVG